MAHSREIYLDNNATTRVLPAAAQEAFSVMEDLYGNPSSSHIAGLQARRILESARDVARQVLGAERGRIVFTSGATEAIQTGIFSALCQTKENLAKADPGTDRGVLLYGATEHKAVPESLRHWNRLLDLDCEILAVPVDQQGQLDEVFLREHIQRAHVLCTMAVNNETGIIQNLESIETIVQSANRPVAWMVDCVQAVGKLELNLSETAIDYAPVSGHKLYAPKGIGILYVREGAPFTPMLAGGGQESGARGGTENLPGVAAIAAVLRAVQDRRASAFADAETLVSFRDRFRASLEKAFPEIVFSTPFEKSVPTTINFSVPGVSSKELLDLFDAAGIRVSSGSACGSAIQGSFVLEAMGLPKWQSDGAIRLSFGPATAVSEVEEACLRIEEAGAALASSCLLVSQRPRNESELGIDGLLQLKIGSMCSWILVDAATRQCVIIDPFEELLHRIETVVRCQNLKVVAVLDTHQHVDHKSPRKLLVETLNNHMQNASQATDILGWPQAVDETVTLGDGSRAPIIRLSESLVIAKTDLPGHTIDGQAFLVGPPSNSRLEPSDVRFLFSGDTLLIGGIGRTDFHSSAAQAMLSSLRKLPKIVSDQSIVCPTHDYTIGFVTTLGSERQHNAFLADILDPTTIMSVDDFLEQKQEVDGKIDDDAQCELVCGHVQKYVDESASSIDVDPTQLTEFFRQHEESLVIDVREAHEFHFAQDWTSLGFDTPPQNVPLTRLGSFLADLLARQNLTQQEIVFVCRSGNRSAKAAQVVRRLGIRSAWHIAGGIALGISPSREVVEAEEIEYAI